jgi:hypothetical protein
MMTRNLIWLRMEVTLTEGRWTQFCVQVTHLDNATVNFIAILTNRYNNTSLPLPPSRLSYFKYN